MTSQIKTRIPSPDLAKASAAWTRMRHEELQGQVADFTAQLATLEKSISRISPLFKTLGRVFGWGPIGKLERARFKLNYKKEELSDFEALQLVNEP